MRSTTPRSRPQLRLPFLLLVLLPALLSAGLLLTACGSGGLAPTLFESSAYDTYVDSLEGVDLHRSAMGSAWLAAGREALSRPQAMEPPWREEIFFSPDRPTAVAWQLQLRRGQRLRAVLVTQAASQPASAGARFFLELFEVRAEDQPPEHVADPTEDDSGDDSRNEVLVHDVDEDGTFLLRLQPELLAGGRVVLEVTAGGQLTFPVEGGDASDIGSRFGDPRDSGRRSHEGVDIFAPRGTPAVAAVDGTVTRVGNNRLGGKVIWMRGDGKSFYYAHLDEHLVRPGRVAAGEAIGRVGNTGNARSTPPHLHFGLFEGGAVDPAPYLASPGTPPAVTADLEALGQPARVTSRLARLRSGPSTSYEIRDELEQNTALHVEAASAGWYRVRLGDGRHGYMSASLVADAERPIRRLTLENDVFLLHRPSATSAFVARLAAGETVQVLAELEPFALVATADEVVGWLSAMSSR